MSFKDVIASDVHDTFMKEDPAPSFYMTISRDHSHARLQEKTRSHRNTSHLTATR